MLKKIAGLSFVLSMTLLANTSLARADNGPTTANIEVSLTISAGCSITSGGDVNLNDGHSAISTLENGATGTGTLKVVCSKNSGTQYSIGFSEGSNKGSGSSAENPVRQLKIDGGGTDTIPYNIYRDSGYNNIWGDIGTKNASPYQTYGGDAQEIQTFYVKVPPINTALSVGKYTDTVLATIDYKQ